MNFWNWFQKKYTIDEVMELVDKIKDFNAGAIDNYLSEHVDKVLDEWKKNHE